MAAPSSPSKLVSSTNLSLSNSSPWRLKVTVEAEPDSDLFLDLAQEESLTSHNTSKRGRKPKESSKRTTSTIVSKKVTVPLKGGDDTIISEDSLALDNTTGIFGSDDNERFSVRKSATPVRNVSTPKAIIVPLKGSEPKEKPAKRRGTPARKNLQQLGLSASEGEDTQNAPVETPKRGRGRPRKSVSNVGNTPKPVPRPSVAEIELSDDQYDGQNNSMDIDEVAATLPTATDDVNLSHIPSPPSSPIPRVLDDVQAGISKTTGANPQMEESIVASEGFSMIAPNSSTVSSAANSMTGLNTPRPTPELEDQNKGIDPAVIATEASVVKRARSRGRPRKEQSQGVPAAAVTEPRVQSQNIDQVAEDVAALSLQSGPSRRRSLRNIPSASEETNKQTGTAIIRERFRELASKPVNPRQAANDALPTADSRGDMSSFRRLLESEPVNVVPGTYEESTVYFSTNRPTRSTSRRRQKGAENNPPTVSQRISTTKLVGNDFEQIIPDHLLAPAKVFGVPTQDKSAPTTPERNTRETPDSEGDPFGEEGRSVRWHADVAGGSFSINSSGLNSSATERPTPETPKQESTHRLLDNEIITEPFRPNAGKLKDGSLMPLVVTREWTNRYWALLTELAFPGTNLSLRSKRPMTSLHPKESPEEAMEARKNILRAYPRNGDGHLILSEHDSSVIDKFEERLRREIVGQKRVAGETRRMWGFSRDQIKEALVVLKVSRQRRIQWVVSAGERLDEWGLA